MEYLYVVLGLLVLYLCKNVFMIEGITATPTPACNTGPCETSTTGDSCVYDERCEKEGGGSGCIMDEGDLKYCRFCDDKKDTPYLECDSKENISNNCKCYTEWMFYPRDRDVYGIDSCDTLCNKFDYDGVCGEIQYDNGTGCRCYKKFDKCYHGIEDGVEFCRAVRDDDEEEEERRRGGKGKGGEGGDKFFTDFLFRSSRRDGKARINKFLNQNYGGDNYDGKCDDN
jgi:hypothetical protein